MSRLEWDKNACRCYEYLPFLEEGGEGGGRD